MNKKCAVILSGCGYLDGAEIRESVLTLLALEQAGVDYEIFAPDIDQHHVIAHTSGEEVSETRNVLEEAARIARGKIQPVTELNPGDFDGLVLPGGYGAAKNLSSFAFAGADGAVETSILKVIRTFHQDHKPIGSICIAPALVAMSISAGKLTIGSDPATAEAIERLGAEHINCNVDECVVDRELKLVSTPAYMYDDGPLLSVYQGINKAIKALADML